MQKLKKNIFSILYLIGFVGIAVIILCMTLFDDEDFKSIEASISFFVLVGMLFITAFVHEVYQSRAVADIIVNASIFIVGPVLLFITMLYGGALSLCLCILSLIMTVVISCRFILKLRREGTAKPDIKRVLALCLIVLFLFLDQLRFDYVGDLSFWVFIPAGVIAVAVCVLILLSIKKVWKNMFSPNLGKVGTVIGYIGITYFLLAALFLTAFIYCGIFIVTANEAFSGGPQRIEYTVLDIYPRSSGATYFDVNVLIDGKECRVSIPISDYNQIEEGCSIVLDYYSGALGFAYYSYYGIAQH